MDEKGKPTMSGSSTDEGTEEGASQPKPAPSTCFLDRLTRNQPPIPPPRSYTKTFKVLGPKYFEERLQLEVKAIAMATTINKMQAEMAGKLSFMNPSNSSGTGVDKDGAQVKEGGVDGSIKEIEEDLLKERAAFGIKTKAEKDTDRRGYWDQGDSSSTTWQYRSARDKPFGASHEPGTQVSGSSLPPQLASKGSVTSKAEQGSGQSEDFDK